MSDEGFEEYDDDYTESPAPEPEPAPVAAPAKKAAKKAAPPREAPLPIAERMTGDELAGEVKFTRSVGLGARNDVAHFSVTLPFNVGRNMDIASTVALASEAFFQAKALVFEQAGLAFEVNETGVVMELLRKTFPNTEEERPAPQREHRRDDDEDDRPRRSSGGGGRGGFPHPADMERPRHIKPDVWRDLCDRFEDFYDNRPDKASGKYKATAPDFKDRDNDIAIWLTAPRNSGGGGRR